MYYLSNEKRLVIFNIFCCLEVKFIQILENSAVSITVKEDKMILYKTL